MPDAQRTELGAGVKPGEPYCGECGYVLTGLTESSKCPECGTPLVDCLRRGAWSDAFKGRRFTSEATLLGLPVLSIAFGPDPSKDEKRGHAKGIIAIGDTARGGVAIGGASVGIVSAGGVSFGVFSLGGFSLGLATASGGWAIGGLSVGGASFGGVAAGGGAAGYIAKGGGAFGVYANGGGTGGVHQLNRAGRADPAAQEMFDQLTPVLGPPFGAPTNFLVMILSLDLLAAILIALAAVLAHRSHRSRTTGTDQ